MAIATGSNRTCSSEPLYAFESVVRTSQVIADEIEQGLAWAADKPMTVIWSRTRSTRSTPAPVRMSRRAADRRQGLVRPALNAEANSPMARR
jgi:phage tail sheath protein FI